MPPSPPSATDNRRDPSKSYFMLEGDQPARYGYAIHTISTRTINSTTTEDHCFGGLTSPFFYTKEENSKNRGEKKNKNKKSPQVFFFVLNLAFIYYQYLFTYLPIFCFVLAFPPPPIFCNTNKNQPLASITTFLRRSCCCMTRNHSLHGIVFTYRIHITVHHCYKAWPASAFPI